MITEDPAAMHSRIFRDHEERAADRAAEARTLRWPGIVPRLIEG